MNKKHVFRSILALPFVIMVIGFLVAPALAVVVASLSDSSGHWTVANYGELLSNKFYRESLLNSIEVSSASTAIGLVVSLICAQSIHRLSPKTGKTIINFTNMASNFSGVPLAFAFMILMGNNGVLTIILRQNGTDLGKFFDLYSQIGVTMVYVYFQIPLGILLLYPALEVVSSELREAGRSLGAKGMQFWWRVGIPMIRPALLSTTAILFANAMGAYATAYALTNGAFNLVPVRIGAMISGDLFLKPNLASALSVILAVILMGFNLFSRRSSHAEESN